MSRRAGTRVLAIVLAVPLLAYAYLGLFSRYAADDYCTAGQVATRGLLGLELQLYEAWSGRFAFTFLVGVVELIGSGATRLLPALAVLAWLGALTWAIARIGRLLGWAETGLAALVVAEVVLVATLGSTADLGQSLYWQTGMLTYLAPLVLLAGYVAIVADCVRRDHPQAASVVACGVLAFLAAGTSETYVAVQVVGLLLAAGLVLASGSARLRRVLLPLLGVGLLGSVVAFGIVALAPGNAVRGGSGPRPAWSYVLGASLDDARQFVHDFWRFETPSFALALLLPAAWGVLWPAPAMAGRLARTFVWAVAIGLAGLALVVVSLLPSFYALSAPEPGRARIIPQLILVCLTVGAGYLAGTLLRLGGPVMGRALQPLAVGLLVLTLVAPLLETRAALAEVDEARAYAQRWDSVDAQVRADHAAGLQDVVVPPLPPTGTVRGMDFVGPDPSDWLNECVARYYGLRTVTARGA